MLLIRDPKYPFSFASKFANQLAEVGETTNTIFIKLKTPFYTDLDTILNNNFFEIQSTPQTSGSIETTSINMCCLMGAGYIITI
jgi:hypothetical protein